MFRLVVTGRVGFAVFHRFSDNHPTGRTRHHAVLLCIFALSVNRNISKSNDILRRYVIDIMVLVTKWIAVDKKIYHDSWLSSCHPVSVGFESLGFVSAAQLTLRSCNLIRGPRGSCEQKGRPFHSFNILIFLCDIGFQCTFLCEYSLLIRSHRHPLGAWRLAYSFGEDKTFDFRTEWTHVIWLVYLAWFTESVLHALWYD